MISLYLRELIRLAHLSSVNRHIISEHYLRGETLKDIAVELSFRYQRVCNNKNQALRRLRYVVYKDRQRLAALCHEDTKISYYDLFNGQ